MSRNTQTVETYVDGFRKNDHAQILSCLTDDIEWIVPPDTSVPQGGALVRAYRITDGLCFVQAAPFALRPLRTVLREDGAILNRALGDTARLELVFCLLFAAGLLP